MNESTQDIKIAVAQTEISQIKEGVADIKNNHLPHIYKRLGEIDSRLAWYAGGLAILVFISGFIGIALQFI